MTINCNGKLIDLNTPRIMGILNLTPDSFFDGGKYQIEEEILKQVEIMLSEGATFIDLGGYSSRPGAKNVSAEDERLRVLPALELILKNFENILVSIDTFRSDIALECIETGACMVNDISAGSMDEKMFETVARLQVPYIIMHMKGTPQDMQTHTTYQNLVKDIIYYFSEKVFELRALGLNDIIIDPGYGFSKTLDQNYEILGCSELLKNLELPILTGISRKSMLYKVLECGPEDALNATTAVHSIALMKGTNILRVHDVKEASETIRIMEQIKPWSSNV